MRVQPKLLEQKKYWVSEKAKNIPFRVFEENFKDIPEEPHIIKRAIDR